MDADTLSIIRKAMHGIRIPDMGTPVFKDECAYSFDTPFADCGIFINLTTLVAISAQYVALDAKKTGNALYLHEKFIQTPKPVELTKEALENGVPIEPYDVQQTYSLYIVTDSKPILIPLPEASLPEFITNVCNAIIQHPGMRAVQAAEVYTGDEELVISKYAEDLVQLDNGKKVSNDPSSWRDEETGDSQNLWLNLSTGYIGGGRRNWDGSGGSGSALKHYEETGKRYPLCVKLGTITANGADVWSYADDEDRMVVDPRLPEHLAHWGIDIMQLRRTDKSLSELEVEANMKFDWSKVMEGSEALQSVSAPGLKGLKNLGSTCYLNSVMQVLFSIPQFRDRYFNISKEQLLASPEPVSDLGVQLSKLARALYSERYVEPLPSSLPYTPEKYTLTPTMFKSLVGEGHREFSSNRQQDASEFYQHVLDLLSQHEPTYRERYGLPPDCSSRLFEFQIEQRLESGSTGQVRYSSGAHTQENLLELRIPIPEVDNEDQEKDSKKQRVEDVSFESCLLDYFKPSVVEFMHPTAGRDRGTQQLRFKTFPKYLMVKLGRYFVDSRWQQVKIEANVAVPETLDLRELRGKGLQEHEVPMAVDDTASSTPGKAIADPSAVAQLVAMGFGENGATRAVLACNNDVEAAVAWVFEHMEDADFNDPLPPTDSNHAVDSEAPQPFSHDEIMMLVSFGYTKEQATAAMITSKGNVERAADWLFTNDKELDRLVSEILGANRGQTDEAKSTGLDDGEGVYSLLGVITHLGKRADTGHYVCHLRRNDKWALFNDDKVALSAHAPLEHGFLYLFGRIDGDSSKLYST